MANMGFKCITGDCLEVLKELPDNSIDSIVTDPPYGLQFMGKKWDYDVPSVDIWKECLRVLKPGGHLLAFAGTRTHHRMVVNIEDAGFEIRDMIAWVYGSGFPKSHNISKAIDKLAGAEREVLGVNPNSRPNMVRVDAAVYAPRVDAPATAPATAEALQWDGWGTALKPALEPICVSRKPLSETSVARNVLKWGTGALNVTSTKIPATNNSLVRPAIKRDNNTILGKGLGAGNQEEPTGRWPANLIHDGGEEVLGLFPETGISRGGKGKATQETGAKSSYGWGRGEDWGGAGGYGDTGSAARFFYCAKASQADRHQGLEGFEEKMRNDGRVTPIDNPYQRGRIVKNHHPTVKPTALMRYLCKLVTPPDGTVLDPFMGSGSTGKAAVLEGFRFIGIERDGEYVELAEARINHAKESIS